LAAPRSHAREFKVSSHNLYNYLVCIFMGAIALQADSSDSICEECVKA
jgi:hypothetical protein